VLIIGESGTGKDHCKAIHNSKRKDENFSGRCFNFIKHNFLRFFGHVKGSLPERILTEKEFLKLQIRELFS
jgi:DNA-binding NtrC family response regulator